MADVERRRGRRWRENWQVSCATAVGICYGCRRVKDRVWRMPGPSVSARYAFGGVVDQLQVLAFGVEASAATLRAKLRRISVWWAFRWRPE